MLRARFGFSAEQLANQDANNKSEYYYSANEACSNFYGKEVASDLKIDTIQAHIASNLQSIDNIRLIFEDDTESPIIGNHNLPPNRQFKMPLQTRIVQVRVYFARPISSPTDGVHNILVCFELYND